MIFEIIEIIQVFIVFQCALFSLYLFTTSSGKSLSNNLMGIFLIVLGLQMSLLTLLDTGNIYVYRFALSIRFVFGPILYFYVRSITEKEYKLTYTSTIHLIPFLMMLTVLNMNVSINRVFLLFIVNFSAIVYLFASYLKINQYQAVIKQIRSSYSAISLAWLQQLVSLLTVALIINFINNTLYNEAFWQLEVMILVETLVLFLLVNVMVIKGLKHPNLFSGISSEDNQIIEDSKEKYATSPLKSEDLQNYRSRLEHLMHTECTYLNPELTLSDVADMLSISSRELSQVINTQFDKNFSEYINHYRIERALKIFNESDDSKMTVLEVLYEVGFNSKSSFYNAFKKHTNMTPKEYRAKLNPT